MVRLARIYHYPVNYWAIVAMAACFLSWDRTHREEWLEARYDDLTRYIGFTDEELAVVLL